MTRKDFAEGLSFWKLFFFFVIGCLFGTLFEELLYFAMHGSYSCRAGVLYGPFSPLYGFGVVLILLILGRKNNSRGIFLTFILSSLLGGVTEYVVSLIVELFFKIRFWDYSNMFLNIHGRTTIPFMAAWGLFATILLKVLYPFLSKYIEKIPKRIGKLIGLLLLVFLIIDMSLTFSAFIRMKERADGVVKGDKISQFLDKAYPDEFMHERFPLLEGKI